MEMFKHFLSWHGLVMLVAAVTMSMALASCSDDDDDDASQLVGTWMGSRDTRWGTETITEIICYSFNVNGTGFHFSRRYEQDPDETRYDYFQDYKLDGEVLYILWDGDDEYDEDGRIRDITDDTLSYRYDDDDDWVTFHRVD